MNHKIWSNLPQFLIDCIYARLPYEEFFRLRCVCKHWNSLVENEPQFLEANPAVAFSVPWFLVVTRQFTSFLLYDTKSKACKWRKLPGFFQKNWVVVGGSAGGLVYALMYALDDEAPRIGVFNVRTKVWRQLPPLLETGFKFIHLHGMLVDAADEEEEETASTYKLIIASNQQESSRSETSSSTQVYDSSTNCWRLLAAQMPRGFYHPLFANAVWCSGNVYVYTETREDPDPDSEGGDDDLLALDLSTETWRQVAGELPFKLSISHNSLLSWQDHIFVGAKNIKNNGRIEFALWKLEESEQQPWNQVDEMPSDLFNWLADEQDYPNYSSGSLSVQLTSFQCRNFVLICGFLEQEHLPFKFVLYDLKQRNWQRLHVPLLLDSVRFRRMETDSSEYGSADSGSYSYSDSSDSEFNFQIC
ncbi:unnamed protein product [Sphagnum balticum]